MRTFCFKARNIGDEKYLTYTMGEECELDEDILDYCQENAPVELVDIIYEEDDDYDYLTYDITGKLSLEEYMKEEKNCEKVLLLLRNIAQGMISLKEQTIPLSYVLLNRSFVYVDREQHTVCFLCVPIETKGALALEFKSFIRQLLANMVFDVDEDLNYVGKLLTYINGNNFNLRGLVGLTEALMEEAGISFEEAGTIEADGVEVVSAQTEESAENIGDIMNSLGDRDDAPLPEIGDDEEEEADEAEKDVSDNSSDELDSILPAGMKTETEEEETVDEIPVVEQEETADEAVSDKPEETAGETPVVEKTETAGETPVVEKTETSNSSEKLQLKTAKKESDINVIKGRIKELVGEVPTARQSIVPPKNVQTIDDLDQLLDNKPPVVKRNVVKVNRAAIIQQTEAEMEAEAAEAAAEAAANAETEEAREESTMGTTENIKVPVIEEIYDDMNIEKTDDKKAKSSSILNMSVGDLVKGAVNSVTTTNVPKALPFLIRVSTNERIMLNKTTFKIGKATRGVDYTIGGNGAVSRQHAIIIQRDGVCYIKDNKSTNHTFVNGKAIEEGAEEILTHDSVVRLADEEFTFKIR